MRVLLDTHILLWALIDPDRLSVEVRQAIESPANEVLFSSASLWEIAIKTGLGREDFAVEPTEILSAALESGFVELPIHSAAAVKVASLPPHHRDPFDRLLIAQAMSEPAIFYTADTKLPAYSELVRLV
ncbi:MAG: type II toxin-antitoxin system VapC family toxin [Alphaproteobacteria bacterium]|nr:type II toxin-antitoxin system VapC family toxin [Alphaproteobacteria bacterium]